MVKVIGLDMLSSCIIGVAVNLCKQIGTDGVFCLIIFYWISAFCAGNS